MAEGILPINYSALHSYAKKYEGPSWATGYWPGGNSGITIGTGFDLGAHSPDDLIRLGFSDALQKKYIDSGLL